MTNNPSAPEFEVSSTLRLYDKGEYFAPTMPNWANIALSVMADKTLTRGQIATEVMLFDRNRDEYSEIGDELTVAEDALVDALNAQLSVNVDEEVDRIESAGVDDVREEWVNWVNNRDAYINPKGEETQITTRGEAKAERCGFYKIDELTPDVFGLGSSLAESLGKLMASPWTSRADRLGDLQTLQAVLSAGTWQVVSDDQDTAFLRAVREGDESEWPVADLADAVESALQSSTGTSASSAVTSEKSTPTPSSGESEKTEPAEDSPEADTEDTPKGVEVEDGTVVAVTADTVDPAVVADMDVKQRSGLRQDVLEACARHQSEQDVEVSPEPLIERVLGSATDHLVSQYEGAIEDAAASVVTDETTVDVSKIVEGVRREAPEYHDVDVMYDGALPMSATLDEARDELHKMSTYHVMQGYTDEGQTLTQLAKEDDETLATYIKN